MPPSAAFEKLMEGNERYTENRLGSLSRIGDERRQELTGGQSPFAAVLACADSRTPPEHIFDAALGELFVCRNAGNLIDEVTLGSIEYAVAHTGCPLVCVLGHNSCGAVGATVASAKDPMAYETFNVDDIVRRLMPAVLATREGQSDDGEWTDAAARKSVEITCQKMVRQSPLMADKLRKGEVMIFGGWYDLGSGKVDVIVPAEKVGR
jgi:carbonic anhydrase